MQKPPMPTIKVKLTEGVVTAKLVKDNAKTVIVELPDGNHIKRSKSKHIIA